jgi:L-aspartate oxidase
LKTDFLVIGSGIAGLNFSIKATQHGRVIIVTKKKMIESNTNLAQGGIAAVTTKDDTFQSHIEDTLKVGCGLSNKRMVEILVKNGPNQIQSLISFGVKFDKERSKPHLTREAGHSKDRILHSGDTTGREVEQALAKTAKGNKKIEVLENHFATDIIVKGDKCYGANVLDIKNKEIVNIFSSVTVLATGGVGYLYKNTSNPQIATGDGISMAFRGGAKVEDMEFVQFHPTTLNIPKASHFLISETFRGEGAVLMNEKGERFMEKYDASGEMAPRDIVSYAVFNELKKGAVYIDIRHRGKDFILNRFPTIHEECLKYGIDITKDLIPVSPAAHYICGGIKTNEYGETSIKKLLAFGECACTEVHGANRLASNSLLDSVVFSSLGAVKAKQFLKNDSKPLNLRERKIHEYNGQELGVLEMELRKGMWDNVGIVRNEKNLSLMARKLRQLKTRINELNRNGLNVQFLQLKNMITVGELITQASLIRKESRGTHYREDYLFGDDKNWLKHICLEGDGRSVAVSFV